MSDQTETRQWDDAAAQEAATAAAGSAAGVEGSMGLPTDKPEVLIGGAFAGGFLAALILRRLGR